MGKSISDMNRGGSGAKMLHGSDLGKNENSVKIKVKELREAPSNFNSPAILDLEDPIHNCEAFALNITNLKALAVLVGLDETADFDLLAKKVVGKSFTLYKTLVNNPKTKKMTASLFFSSDGK